jgi:hypothetical protein
VSPENVELLRNVIGARNRREADRLQAVGLAE